MRRHRKASPKITLSAISIIPDAARKVLAEGGKLNAADLVKRRARYFTDGVVLGDKAFVEEVFKSQREIFSPKRKTHPRVRVAALFLA